MALVDERSETTPSEDALQFACPACQQELSIPAALAGVEGPCPRCGEQIAAPLPAAHLPARLLSVPEDLGATTQMAEVERDPNWEREEADAWPRPRKAPAEEEEIAEDAGVAEPLEEPALRHVFCGGCGCELAIDPELAHLEGGPCPRCQTWIDMQGRQGPAAGREGREGFLEDLEQVESEFWGAAGEADGEGAPTFGESAESPAASGLEGQAAGDEDKHWAAAAEELNQLSMTEEPGPELQFRKMAPDTTIERRTVRKRKKRRQLPPEFYVGHAAGDLDAQGQESAARMRRERFPEEGVVHREEEPAPIEPGAGADRGTESILQRGLPVIFGVVIPLLGGLFAALHFNVIQPADLPFLGGAPVENAGGAVIQPDPLAREIEETEQVLKGRARHSYRAIEGAILGFFEAETWGAAQSYLLDSGIPANSEALAFLRMFPREAFRGSTVRVIDYLRIPDTERFVFTTHVSKTYAIQFMDVESINDLLDVGRSLVVLGQVGSQLHLRIFDAAGTKVFDQAEHEWRRRADVNRLVEALRSVRFPEVSEVSAEETRGIIESALAVAGRRGEQRVTFVVAEETEEGVAKLHAMQLYQSWKGTLTQFLETSGAPGARFYVALRLSNEESSITFPEDGRYVKLDLQDLLVAEPWIKDVYVREGSWAGTRLLTALDGSWAMGVLDLEWLRGPTGEAFVHVAGVHSSTWGNFPN